MSELSNTRIRIDPTTMVSVSSENHEADKPCYEQFGNAPKVQLIVVSQKKVATNRKPCDSNIGDIVAKVHAGTSVEFDR